MSSQGDPGKPGEPGKHGGGAGGPGGSGGVGRDVGGQGGEGGRGGSFTERASIPHITPFERAFLWMGSTAGLICFGAWINSGGHI